MYAAMIKKYGSKKGRSVFYAYMNKHKLDESKSRPKSKSVLEDTELWAECDELARLIDTYPEDAAFYGETEAYFARIGVIEEPSGEFKSREDIKVTRKDFYGAFFPIINFESKGVAGEENYYVEGFLSTPLRDLQGETVSPSVLDEWSKVCIQPPHNLVWLFHDSPYAAPENKDKPAIVRLIESAIRDHDTPKGKIKGLWVRGIFNKVHPKFNDTWQMVKTGFMNAFSAEFAPLDIDSITKTIRRGQYYSSSLVMAPANEGATITAAYMKSFMGTDVKMSSTNNSASPANDDSLENLLAAFDASRRQAYGPAVPGVPGTGVPSTPIPAPAAPIAPPVVPPVAPPVAPPPVKTPTELAIEQMMSKLDGLRTDIDALKPRAPEPPPPPTQEEIAKVLKYLTEKAKPAPPAPIIPPAPTVTVAAKMFTKEEVEEEVERAIDAAKREGRIGPVIYKGASGTMIGPTTGQVDLSDVTIIDDDNLEGMLQKMDLMRGTQLRMVVK